MWLSLLIQCLIIGPFIFRVLEFPSPGVAPGLGLCTGCILLCKISKLLHSCCVNWPFGYPVRWLTYIWTKVLLMLKYLCNQAGTASLFLFRLAECSLTLANKHGITLIPAYIHTHINAEANYLSWSQLVPEWHQFPHKAQSSFHLWGEPEVNLLTPSCTNQCQ